MVNKRYQQPVTTELEICLRKVEVALSSEEPSIGAAYSAIQSYIGLQQKRQYQYEDGPLCPDSTMADVRLGLSIRTLNSLESLKILYLGQLAAHWLLVQQSLPYGTLQEVQAGLHRAGIEIKTGGGLAFNNPIQEKPQQNRLSPEVPKAKGWYWAWKPGLARPVIIQVESKNDTAGWKLFAGPLKEPQV